MKTLRLVSGLLVLGIVGAALADTAVKKKIVQQPISALKWTPVAPNLPILGADGWKGAGGSFCTFAKFPKGFSEPKHFHTNDLHVVVLEGQWGSWAPGDPEQYLAAGGYQFIPGGTEHLSKCGPASDCVVYDCGPAAFDVQGMAAMKP